MTLNIGSGDDAARSTSIYAPDNNGNFYANVSTAVDDSGFRNGRIYSSEGTGQIRVDCNAGAGTYEYECQNMYVFGGNATKVDINCESGVSCRDFILFCPVDSSLDGTGEKSCNFACNGSFDCRGDIYVSTGGWDTYLDVSSYDCNHVCDINVYCNYNGGTFDTCTFDTPGSLVCSGDCQPTSTPTGIPSSIPSIMPSSMPTNEPTAPTKDPTMLPSDLPSSSPTFLPSTDPSTMPTNLPSIPPTQVPSNQPTMPTLAPSSVPSNLPSNVPSDSPTFICSVRYQRVINDWSAK